MELKKINIEDIKPYPNNPRKNDMAVEAVMESIRQCEYISPIVIDENNVILCGHTRWKALKELGYSEAECVIKTGLTDEQKRKYRILDNKTAEIAEWDYELLEIEMAGLDFGNIELDFDFEFDEEAPEIIEDEVPELDPKGVGRSKPGDIWLCGRHRLMCGDSTCAEGVQMLAGGAQCDLLVTDPPYNVELGTKDTPESARKRHRRQDGLLIKNDSWENENDFVEFLCKAFENAEGVMKPGAAFYIWHASQQAYNFARALEKVGWESRQQLIWVKQMFTLGRQDYQWKHEPCYYGWKSGAAHTWNNDRKQTTVLEFDRPIASPEHPTMKPVALFEYLIRNSSKKGDIVLDLFAGSGTTMIAAEQNGRTAYLMEIDPYYCDVILTRWENLTGERAERL